MADYTLTATAAQDSLLTATRVAANTQNGTTLTNLQYLQARFDSLMNEALIKSRDRRWDALDGTAKDTALTAGEV
mgnify:CR=1 FL=1|jgi:hypothetical protein|tara:strand:- start:340 stop:564 length:225 start_codon:yes stop_codon:yes gene_type:complete